MDWDRNWLSPKEIKDMDATFGPRPEIDEDAEYERMIDDEKKVNIATKNEKE